VQPQVTAVARPGDTIAIESPPYFGLLHVLKHPASGPSNSRRMRSTALTSTFSRVGARAKIGDGLPLRLELQQSARPYDARREKTRIASAADQTQRASDRGRHLRRHLSRGERPKPFGALDPAADTIYCSSFSKTIAPGYRIGWLAAGRRMQAVLQQKLASTLAMQALTQAALAGSCPAAAMTATCAGSGVSSPRTSTGWCARSSGVFRKGTRVSRPAGGLVMWAELPADTRALFAEAVRRGISFAPGDVFSASSRYRHCLRLSCGYPGTAGSKRAWRRSGRSPARRLA